MTDKLNEWYYVVNGHPQGPVTLAVLQAAARDGRLKAQDQIWRDPMPQWVAAGSVMEIFAPASIGDGIPPVTHPTAAPEMQPLHYAPRQTPPPDICQNAGVRMLIPVGRSGWAIAAGYAGLLGIFPPIGLIAIVLGIIAIMHIRRDPSKHGMGRAVTGITLGTLFTGIHLVALFALILDIS